MKTAGGRSHRQARSSWKGGVGARSQSGNCGREVLLKLIPEGWAQWVGHGWRGGAFQVDGTGYAKPSKLPSPLAPGAFPLSVGFIHFTLNISAFPWNVLLGREGGNQVPKLSSVTLTIHFPGLWVGGGRLPGMLLTGPDLGFWQLFLLQEQSCGYQNPCPSPPGPEITNAGLSSSLA